MSPTIDQLSRAFIGVFPRFSPDEQRLIRATYLLLATGHPASPDAIAERAAWAVHDVERRLATWPAVYRATRGEVLGFLGLSSEPASSHQFTVAGLGTAFTWCALDPLFIAQVLGVDAEVTSLCPTTRTVVRLAVSPSGVSDLDPPATVVSLLWADKPFDDDVRASFCHFVHFFASPAVAETWTQDDPGTFSLPVVDAFEVARNVTTQVFPTLVQTPGSST